MLFLKVKYSTILILIKYIYRIKIIKYFWVFSFIISHFIVVPFNATDFENLYNQYKVLVYNVALNYLQNIEDAEEIIKLKNQKYFIILIRYIFFYQYQNSTIFDY